MRWGAIASTLAALGSAGAYIGSRRLATRRSPLLLLLAVAIGLTAVQLVPLPAFVANLVAGPKLDLVTANAQAWGEIAPGMVMASYDPPATLLELAKLVGYAALAFATCRLATLKHGRGFLAMIVVGTALLVAVVAIVHALVGATEIYGFVSSPAAPRLLSPIVNDNHFASLMALAVPVAVGLAISRAGAARMAWLGAALVCAGVGLLISSRGGAIGLLVGVTTTLAILFAQYRRRNADRPPTLGPQTIARFTVLGCLIVLVGVLAANEVFGEIASTRLDEISEPHSKFQVWVQAADMLEENHWLGIGRGAFEPAFTRWSKVGDQTYSHAENSYLQVALDWGIPGAAVIAILGSLVAIASIRRWRHGPLEAGALGALAALAVHEVADFSLELPLIAMMVITISAILLPTQVSSGDLVDGRPRAATTRVRWQRIGLLALGATVALLAASPLGRLAHADAAALDASPELAVERAPAICERHPSDYLLVGRAAQALLAQRDPRAVPVVMRALALAPLHPGLHRLAATMLLRSGHAQQAKVEFALAMRSAPSLVLVQLVKEIAATYPAPAEAVGALTYDLGLAPLVAAILRDQHLDELELAYTVRLAMLNPDNAELHLLLADAAIRQSRGDLCVAPTHVAFRLHPDARAARLVARCTALGGDLAGGIAFLQHVLAEPTLRPPERLQLLNALADAASAANSLDLLATTLDELSRSGPDEAQQIEIHRRRAELHDRRGETTQAAWERDQIRTLQATRTP